MVTAAGAESPTERRPREWARQEAMAYRRRRREYVAATAALVTWLQARLADIDEIDAQVTGRAKEVRSVEQKLRARERTQPGRDASYRDLPDLVGVRVVVRLANEIDIVAQEIHERLLVDKDVDARDERGREDTPGYRGRHFDARVPPDADLPELLTVQAAEIQVRTRAADLWAALEHELRYKGARDLPPARSRQFVLAASLFELAERELEDLRAWHVGARLRDSTAAKPPVGASLEPDDLARLLSERYPDAAASTPRRLGWMLELLAELRLETATSLRAALPTVPDARILALVQGRSTVDTVRMLDDELLLLMPDAYVRANRAVPDERNPQRVQTLMRRRRRLGLA